MKQVSSAKCFGGTTATYEHPSAACQSQMRFSIYLPQASKEKALPVVYWLSGLTCTEENFTVKAGAQRYATEHNLIIVAPDTSPRGLNLPGENESWDFGTGAGFYLNATQPPFAGYYNMYDYIVSELPSLIEHHFPAVTHRRGIFGHSMGGHGALVIGLRNQDRFQSISGFAPICAPSKCPWGQKAFHGYLGNNPSAWLPYDASHLLSTLDHAPHLLIDQGEDDPFLDRELLPKELEQACKKSGHSLTLRRHAGYDHSYFFIATFMGDHMAHHAGILHKDVE